MEKYHKVENKNKIIAIIKIITNFNEKLINLNIPHFIINKFDFLWAFKSKLCVFIQKII